MPGTARELQLIFLLAGGAVALLVVVVLIARARRRSARRSEAQETPPAIDLADLHAMLNAGTISQQEFDRLKAVVTRRFATRHVPNAPLERARGFDVLPPIDDID
jgi:hypothetical protein